MLHIVQMWGASLPESRTQMYNSDIIGFDLPGQYATHTLHSLRIEDIFLLEYTTIRTTLVPWYLRMPQDKFSARDLKYSGTQASIARPHPFSLLNSKK